MFLYILTSKFNFYIEISIEVILLSHTVVKTNTESFLGSFSFIK